MNTTLLILGICNVVLAGGSMKKNGTKRNYVAYLNLLIGLLLIVFSFTIFAHNK